MENLNSAFWPEGLDLMPPDRVKEATNGASSFNDPAFTSNKKAAVHRWVPWIAGFSREFVQGALDRHLQGIGTVLDPFAGVGTTLVEAMLAGHNAIGFEINPYAALACRTKLHAYQIDLHDVTHIIAAFARFYHEAIEQHYTPKSAPPLGFKTRAAFYSPSVLWKVLIVQDFIAQLDNDSLRDLFRVAFASTMVAYSNYSYEPSLGRRATAGKEDIEDFPVGETITSKLHDMAQDIGWIQQQLNGKHPSVHIFNESFFIAGEQLPAASVDLIITSPPYLNNYHYNRNTRPHLYWLGYTKTPNDLRVL